MERLKQILHGHVCGFDTYCESSSHKFTHTLVEGSCAADFSLTNEQAVVVGINDSDFLRLQLVSIFLENVLVPLGKNKVERITTPVEQNQR